MSGMLGIGVAIAGPVFAAADGVRCAGGACWKQREVGEAAEIEDDAGGVATAVCFTPLSVAKRRKKRMRF